MTRMIGRNVNKNDTAFISDAILVNSSTSTTIIAPNDKRMFLHISNDGENKDSWIKLQAASLDNDKKGIFLKGRSFWEMPNDNPYTGEICVIGDVSSSNIYVTEY